MQKTFQLLANRPPPAHDKHSITNLHNNLLAGNLAPCTTENGEYRPFLYPWDLISSLAAVEIDKWRIELLEFALAMSPQ